jgi:predicted ferric reductase
MWNWITDPIAQIRKFPLASAEEGHQIHKKNQFLKGEVDFNVLSLWLVAMPTFITFFWYIPISMDFVNTESEGHSWDDQRLARERTYSMSMLAGFYGVFALSWFLIPVARHSVLLVAMGWSPVHALRLHIWAGHVSFFLIFLHAVTMVAVWIMDPYRVYESFIPPAECWGWDASNVDEEQRRRMQESDGAFVITCNYQWYNLTGILAMVMFSVLWVSSLHWFRRRNYRLFYLLHVTFGSLMMITSILHYAFIVMYWLPSITYYLASTTPTLIQALASRFRGGVKITKVIPLENAAGCLEVHVATNEETTASLNREPSQFVKLCVPKISIVWHPFTVFAHPTDPTTLRFLFRPVGPFTTALAKQLTGATPPVTMLDGFYKGTNRCQEAMGHDCVSIVSGGVALTPFLSMIPALLTEISNGLVDSPLRTISVHWACREEGLMKHITENYFEFFQEQARALGKVKLEITIYYTGKTIKKGSEGENSPLDLTESPHSENNDSSSTASTGDLLEKGIVDTQTPERVVSDNSNAPIRDGDPTVHPVEIAPGLGFPMELARMMGGRFSKFYFNIPVFVAFNIPVWIGFVILFETYDWNLQENFKQMAATTVMTLVMTAMFGVFGVLVEASVLHLGKYWPTPTFDDFEIYLPLKHGAPVSKCNLQSEYTSLNIVYGRPTGKQVLAAAESSEAPGIFMCGPVPMVDMVRKETNKQNSWLGLTRFCLYEEPFEF